MAFQRTAPKNDRFGFISFQRRYVPNFQVNIDEYYHMILMHFYIGSTFYHEFIENFISLFDADSDSRHHSYMRLYIVHA